MNTPQFEIGGSTRPFAVLGHPIAHSLSPVMHNAAIRALGLDAVYLAFDVAPEDLMEVLRAMGRMGFEGVNLTIPHKEAAYRGVEHLATSAERAGSVNTVVFRKDGTLEGHVTDGYGLVKAVGEAFGRSFAGADVLVLGCGGAGRSAALEAVEQGAARVRVANRTSARAVALAEELRGGVRGSTVVEHAEGWPPSPEVVREADLLLNATSLGMKEEDDPLLTPGHAGEGQALLDMTYVLRETPMMRAARAGGAQAANGLGMLLHQGARSFEIWTGVEPPTEPMRRALKRAVYGEGAE